MIRVYKRENPPASLTHPGNTTYNNQDVQSALLEDQKQKCYICERICITDFEIDHFLPVSKHPHLKLSWGNLFLACSYCNGKKLAIFDNILNPSKEDIEDLIKAKHDVNKKIIYFTAENQTEQIHKTIELLNKVFNGSTKIRTKREENFYEYFLSRINVFMSSIISYLDLKDNKTKGIIIEQLSADAEFLAFKYAIIIENKDLLNDFREHIIWNK